MKKINEKVDDKELFLKNFAKLKKPTYVIHNISGFPSFTNRWHLIHTDALLTLLKYFKKKYQLRGTEQKAKSFVDQVASEKYVRASAVYSPYKIIRKDVLFSKYKNEERAARVLQYGNKFFPIDREDLHIMAVDLIEMQKLLGPCRVVNLGGATQEDIGNALGDTARMERVFKFLQVPKGSKQDKTATTDGDGKPLTSKQQDLFNNPANNQSLDIGFESPEITDASIRMLQGIKNRAHKVRAALLMIRRAEGALKNVKDKEKEANLRQSLEKWKKYKNTIIEA